MFLTPLQTIIITICIALGTMVTRFTPFLLFPENKKQPEIVLSLGSMLPPAMIGLLVVYCLKSVSFLSPPYGIPELISIAVICGLHLWKQNALLSIGVGTALYMFFVQVIFI